AERFFGLPMDEKLSIDMARSKAQPGYEARRGQTLQARSPPDLKEGFYLGIHIPPDDERVIRHVNAGPNQWPSAMPDFRTVTLRYFEKMQDLAGIILEGIALSLDLPRNY